MTGLDHGMRGTEPSSGYPAALDLRGLRTAGFLASELRVLGAEVAEFSRRVEQIERAEGDRGGRSFEKLFKGFSAQLELTHAALLEEFHGNYRTARFGELLTALRTYLEEGVFGWRRDPAENARFTAELVRRELRLALDHDFSDIVPKPRRGAGTLDVREFDARRISADAALLAQLESICGDLVIDQAIRGPQSGYARALSASEIGDELRRPGSRLCVPYLDEIPVGLYLISTTPEGIPSHARRLVREFTGDSALPGRWDGWAGIVGLSQSGRQALRPRGIFGYRELSEAVKETARGWGIERLWGEVRIGERANTARARHVAVGWLPTGLHETHHGHPYELLLLRTYDPGADTGPNSVAAWDRHMKLASSLDRFERLASMTRDFAYVTRSESSAPLSGVLEEGQIEMLRKAIGGNAAVTSRRVDGKLEYHVGERGTEPAFAVKQKVPGTDLWKIEDPVFYERGLNEPLRSFEDIIAALVVSDAM